jgi:DNA-binding GntR family transcriptional regulator
VDKLDPDDPRPPYVQVAAAIRNQIQAGTYSIGSKLPPHQDVADHFGVSVNTVKRAYGVLQEERMIVPRQGMGTFVRREAPEVSGQDPADVLPAVLEQLAELRQRLDAVEDELRNRAAHD